MVTSGSSGTEDEDAHFVTSSPDTMSELDVAEDCAVEVKESANGHGGEEDEEKVSELNGPEHSDEGSVEEGEDEEEDEDEEEEEEEDEDEEPALKYERLGGSAHELLKGKDSASALTYGNRRLALGTHAGILHVLDLNGQRVKSVKPHTASIIDLCVDETGDFIATASIDGQVAIQSVSTTEGYVFDMKRPMRTIALEPNFAKRSTRSFVCGGLAGNLVVHEKGWLGHKETLLHSGEGPIWQVRWRGRLIAWANDLGVKIYDTTSQMRIIFIDRPADSPRPDLFKCTLHWQDDSTLLIAWADQIKVARIRARPRSTPGTSASVPPLIVEITAVFQLDCMIAGIIPHADPAHTRHQSNGSLTERSASPASTSTSTAIVQPAPALTSLLVLAYTPPDTSFLTGNEAASSRAEQARKAAERPELRIISRAGEELAADALSITNYEKWGCNDYVLVDVPGAGGDDACYMVLSPRDIVVVRPRDWRDHVAWLVERKRYEEALEELERQSEKGAGVDGAEGGINATEIGQRYIEHLVDEGDYVKAAHLCPKVCGQDVKRWEDWIFVFAQKHQLQAIIPYVPTQSPTLGHLVYEMVLAHFLSHDRQALLHTIISWPKGIYDIPTIIIAVQAELDRTPSSSSASSSTPDSAILMECLAELYMTNRQPGKALPYFLRLRRPNVFDLIREYNLFSAVQDQALLLVEFDHELMERRRKTGDDESGGESAAIKLLVDHIHSIPIVRVVQQLQSRGYYLYLYLDALSAKDPHLTSDFADTQVKLYAEYNPHRLIDFLRASNYYSLEEAYNVCNARDLVTEMVFLLGHMGNNKKALTIIIERLGDVHRAIEFAKEQRDDDLWEDLLRYSETRPAFIRGLLENVGAEIDPIRLIRRIKNGLEIPGLKGALIKILHDFNIQTSLLEGCQTIFNGDCADLSKELHHHQTSGFFLSVKSPCPICTLPLVQTPQSLLLLYLCRHVVHAGCVGKGEITAQLHEYTSSVENRSGLNAKIALTAMVRARLGQKCPVCHKKGEGIRT